MDEHMDRRVLPPNRIKLDGFDRGRPIGKPLGIAEALAHRFAVRRVALDDLRQVGRVLRLVVGVVELLLIEVEPDPRAFSRAAGVCANAVPLAAASAAEAAKTVRRLKSPMVPSPDPSTLSCVEHRREALLWNGSPATKSGACTLVATP
jgi:hypothetical protein